MIAKNSKIFVTGHKGLVGSSIVRRLKFNGYQNLILKTKNQLDLRNQNKVKKFFKKYKIDAVINAAATAGGIEANNKFEKTFKFNNYNEVVLFSNKVMQIAIDQDHHPVINIKYDAVHVSITDYEKGTVSEKCKRFITEVNKIK